jgi:hypothetical protein
VRDWTIQISRKRLDNFVFSRTRFSSLIGVPMKRIETRSPESPDG